MDTLIAIAVIILMVVMVVIGAVVIISMVQMRRDIREYKYLSKDEKKQAESMDHLGDNIKELVGGLREAANEQREKGMVEYAKRVRKLNEAPPNLVLGGIDRDDRIRTKNVKAGSKILIPEGLSEEEKAVLKEFYDL